MWREAAEEGKYKCAEPGEGSFSSTQNCIKRVKATKEGQPGGGMHSSYPPNARE